MTTLDSQPPHLCETMRWALEDSRSPFNFNDRFREYSVSVNDANQSALTLTYCPFTGERLPASLRDEWFETLERAGVDISIGEMDDPRIPSDMQTGEWWRARAAGASST